VTRPLEELVVPGDPGWAAVAELVSSARNAVEVLPGERAACDRTLAALQVTTRSALGGVAHATGGLLFDGGWLRLLGGGSPRLPRDLAGWNRPGGDGPPRIEGALLVGDDAAGGFFALNGGAFEGEPGNVFYLAPDALGWEDLGRGYTDLVAFACQGDLARFYEAARWPGWEADVAALAGDRAFSIQPPPWAQGPPLAERSRRAVPVDELLAMQLEMAAQLRG
jgi:hypothetical protein